MKFMALVGTAGPMPGDAVEEMNRGWPAYEQVLATRSGLRLGRELRLPDEGVATVRARGREPLITDGPFAETKEYVAGLDVFDASGWEDAIELESLSPVARFLPFEIRMLPESFRLGPAVTGFAERDDAAGTPFMLMVWAGGEAGAWREDPQADSDSELWRTRLEVSGAFVLGGKLSDPDDARTLRLSAAEALLSAGPFIQGPEYIAGIEVIRAASLPAAASLAATHPLAPLHPIEARPFHVEGSSN